MMSSTSSRKRSIIHNTDEENYNPLAIRYTKKDGTSAQCNVFCGLSSKDFVLIIGCYVAFYSFLFGISALLLKGVIATDETNSFLWGFLIIGIVFSISVFVAVYLGTRPEETKTKKEEDIKPRMTIDEENQGIKS